MKSQMHRVLPLYARATNRDPNALRRERTLCLCRTQQAMVLLESMGFHHSFRHKSARDRGATDYDPFFRVSCEAISNESQRERRPDDTTNDAT